MGIELVKLILLQHATQVSGRAFKLLAYMAATALDRPNGRGQPARLYFAGEEPLVHVLYGLHADPTPHRLREVRRVLKELREAGLIEAQVDKAGWRRAQSFALRIGGSLGGESAPALGGESAHPIEGESAPRWVGNLPTPRTHTGTTEDSSQDTREPVPASTTDRARHGHREGRPTHLDFDPAGPHPYTPDDSGAYCALCDLSDAHPRHTRRHTA